jgi:hypothetical protein
MPAVPDHEQLAGQDAAAARGVASGAGPALRTHRRRGRPLRLHRDPAARSSVGARSPRSWPSCCAASPPPPGSGGCTGDARPEQRARRCADGRAVAAPGDHHSASARGHQEAPGPATSACPHLARVFISGSDTVTGLTASGSRQWLPGAGRATASPRPSSWPRPRLTRRSTSPPHRHRHRRLLPAAPPK